jgi:hypothetical protein
MSDPNDSREFEYEATTTGIANTKKSVKQKKKSQMPLLALTSTEAFQI